MKDIKEGDLYACVKYKNYTDRYIKLAYYVRL